MITKVLTGVAAIGGAMIVFSGAMFFTTASNIEAADEAKIGSSLNGHRFEFPCKEPMPEKPKKGAGCSSALVKGNPKTTDNFTATKTFGGQKGTMYNVTLRFRGVVEPMMYKGGKQDEKDHRFYVGGVPNNRTYNIYKIDIASPKSHYFLNRDDKVGHRIFTIDYTKTIQIEGGSKIVLSGDGQNGKLISNFSKLTIPEIDKDKPYNGQYIQINVVKVEEVK